MNCSIQGKSIGSPVQPLVRLVRGWLNPWAIQMTKSNRNGSRQFRGLISLEDSEETRKPSLFII